jgi:ribA/ribD-fused uncharacterized protein
LQSIIGKGYLEVMNSPKYSRQSLVDAIESGESFDYELFYGGHCSQWARSPILIDGVHYPTAEHYMMVQKALTFDDTKALSIILDTDSPFVAKMAGRSVKNYDDTVWAAVRYEHVLIANRAKFTQNEEFFQYLINTENKVLVEASPTDTIWGIGLPESSEDCLDPRKWRGENLLGFVCMQVRDELRS